MLFKKSTISVIIILVGLATIVVMSGLNFLIPQDTRIDADENTNERGYKTMEKIYLTTKDNIKIVANLYGVDNPVGWLVLVHMMPATKESYQELAQRFQNLGYESIAIDLRGHGESDAGPDGYLNKDFDHQKSILDLEAAVGGLIQSRNAVPEKISFIGASIGANLSLQFISDHPEFKTAVLLSAGLDYRGIKTEPLVRNLKSGQKVFFVYSSDDKNNTKVVEENQKLYELVPAGVQKQEQPYKTGGHGTDILKSQPELMSLIFEFIK